MSLLKEGQKLRETYEVERFLGEGAFTEVYRVQHRFLGRQAMKVLKIPGVTVCEIEQMLGEALLLSRIGHPNVIRVFDANVLEMAGGRFGFFTMEYVAGGSLDRFWRSYRDNLMPIEQAIEVMKQVCAGIAVAHAEEPRLSTATSNPKTSSLAMTARGFASASATLGWRSGSTR